MRRADATPRPGRPVRGSTSGRPIMALLDLLGRRATLGILWALAEGPASFRALQERAGGVAASTLNTRLAELRDVGLVERTDAGYALTDDASALLEAGAPLVGWADDWAARITARTSGPDGEAG